MLGYQLHRHAGQHAPRALPDGPDFGRQQPADSSRDAWGVGHVCGHLHGDYGPVAAEGIDGCGHDLAGR